MVWTDHASTLGLLQQIKLSAINTDKLNLRLIHAVIYLSQFLLDVKYKPSRNHKILNVFSCFSIQSPVQLKALKVETIYDTLIELLNGF